MDIRPWEYFSRGTLGIERDCGFPADTLTEIYVRTGCMMAQERIVEVFRYIHQGPTPRNFKQVMGREASYFSNYLHLSMRLLGDMLQPSLENDARYDHDNHSPYFPFHVTGFVDTVPIQIAPPTSSTMRELLYDTKHHMTALTFELAVDLRGRPFHLSGPHLPVIPPTEFYSESSPSLQPLQQKLEPYEFLLGTAEYSSANQVLSGGRDVMHLWRTLPLPGVPHDQPALQTALQLERAKAVRSQERAMKRHGSLRGEVRLGAATVSHLVHCVVGAEAVHAASSPPFKGFGAWPHDPTTADELQLEAASLAWGHLCEEGRAEWGGE
jgi:hypothetical protein